MPDLQRLTLPIGPSAVAMPSTQNTKIDKSAKDFESILLGSWLQEAEHTFAKVPGTDDEESEDDATEQLQEGVAMRPLGEAMAANGGIGIARMISKQLHKADAQTSATAPTVAASP